MENTPRLYDVQETKVLTEHLHHLSKTQDGRKEYNKSRYAQQKAVKESLSKGVKSCAKCGEEKKLFDFYVDKKNFSGYSSYCKECKKATT